MTLVYFLVLLSSPSPLSLFAFSLHRGQVTLQGTRKMMHRVCPLTIVTAALVAQTTATNYQHYRRDLYGESSDNHTCQLCEYICTPYLPGFWSRNNHARTNQGRNFSPDDPILSCSSGAQANLTDSCCTETFGGLVVWVFFGFFLPSFFFVASKSSMHERFLAWDR